MLLRYILFVPIVISSVLSVHERLKRFLLFPRGNPTRLQFIGGVGIPVDLELESVTIGYVLKAEYFLPHNISHFKTADYIAGFGEKRRTSRSTEIMKYKSLFDDSKENDTDEDFIPNTGPSDKNNREYSRWLFYKAIEVALDSKGLSGHVCLLRAICETATIPFVIGDDNSLFDELLHIFFTPSSTKDNLSYHQNNEYFHAEQLGRSQAPCDRIFYHCPESPMDLISAHIFI